MVIQMLEAWYLFWDMEARSEASAWTVLQNLLELL